MKRKGPSIKMTVAHDLFCDIREAARRDDRVLPLGNRMYSAKYRMSYYGSVVHSVCRERGYPIAKMRDLQFKVAGVHVNATDAVLEYHPDSMAARLVRAVRSQDYEQATELRDAIHNAGCNQIHINP